MPTDSWSAATNRPDSAIPDKSLDNFDFAFQSQDQWRVAVTGSLIFRSGHRGLHQQAQDVLFLGAGRDGLLEKVIWQAISHCAIVQQGYKVLYRETHVLLDELADAIADGTRKEYMDSVATAPLLIIDDFGMRKLPHTAAIAEDLCWRSSCAA